MCKIQQHNCCNAIEISKCEYLRLVQKEPLENRFSQFKAERERLKKISADRASKWPNTLVNLRLLRERAQQDKIKKEDQDMIKQDRENVGIRHKERLDKINKANSLLKKLHIKTFQSNALINDVMKERVEQLKLTKSWKDKWIEQEKDYHNEMLKTMARLNQEEEEKMKKAHKNNKLLIKAQNEQVELIHKQVAKVAEEEIHKRERFKKQLQEDEAREIANEKQKKQKIATFFKDVAEINKSLQDNGAILVARERKLEEEIATYWTKKKIQEAEFKKIKDTKEAAKRKHQDIMTKRLGKLYKDFTVKVMGDEEKYRKAREKAEDEAFIIKEAKAKALLAECHRSRQLQMARKKELLEEEKKDIAFEDEHAAKRIQQLIEEDKQEEIKRHNYNIKIAQFCIDQSNQKKEASRITKENALKEDIEALIQLKADEDYFKSLAN